MLKTRLITGSLLFTVFVSAFFFAPPTVFSFLLATVLGCAAWEWARLLKLKKALEDSSGIRYAYALSTSCAFIFLRHLDHRAAHTLYLIATVFWLGIMPWALARPPQATHHRIWRIFLLAVGPAILIAGGHALLSARAFSPSFAFSILLFVWAADSGAYFAGKRFGKHKLAPSISPGKSWEGAFGGMLFAFVAALAMQRFEPSLFTIAVERFGLPGAFIALTVLLVLSIAGDLFESLLKRQAEVKDSSALLPGHGGVLDRIDALLPVLPLVMLLLHKR